MSHLSKGESHLSKGGPFVKRCGPESPLCFFPESFVKRCPRIAIILYYYCHSQGVPFCTEMDSHQRVLVLNGVPVAVHSLVKSATSLSDLRSVASGAAVEVNNRRGLASK